jgi:hypothetical protein
MSIVLDRFDPGVLTADQLNALVDAITAKFNGQIGVSDLSSPLKLPGVLDMQQFEILHLYKLWGAYNLAERASTVTLQNVLDTVNSAGGGVIMLPANYTETVGTGGVTVGSNTLFVGQGDTSLFTTGGTMTAGMFRNKANGNSGIHFMNLKIDTTAATGGTQDAVVWTRTVRARFTDVWFTTGRAYAVRLTTDSAASSCLDTNFFRCRFDVSSPAVGAVIMTDVQNANFQNCKFTQGVNTAIAVTFTALGATSNCDRITLDNCKFETSAGTTQSFVQVTAGATAGISDLAITNCKMQAVTATLDYFVDINGGSNTLKTMMRINNNTMRVSTGLGSLNKAGLRIRNCAKFEVCNNTMGFSSGNGMGFLIGASDASGAVGACTDYTVSENNITANHWGMAFVHPGSGDFDGVVVTDNNVHASLDSGFAMWNLGGTATALTMKFNFSGNHATGTAPAGWASYTDLGVTRGGRAGNANTSFLVWQGNVCANVLVGNTAGDDLRETETVTRKCLTDTDDAGAATDNIR